MFLDKEKALRQEIFSEIKKKIDLLMHAIDELQL